MFKRLLLASAFLFVSCIPAMSFGTEFSDSRPEFEVELPVAELITIYPTGSVYFHSKGITATSPEQIQQMLGHIAGAAVGGFVGGGVLGVAGAIGNGSSWQGVLWAGFITGISGMQWSVSTFAGGGFVTFGRVVAITTAAGGGYLLKVIDVHSH